MVAVAPRLEDLVGTLSYLHSEVLQLLDEHSRFGQPRCDLQSPRLKKNLKAADQLLFRHVPITVGRLSNSAACGYRDRTGEVDGEAINWDLPR